jgi:hypothetical protein
MGVALHRDDAQGESNYGPEKFHVPSPSEGLPRYRIYAPAEVE